MTTLQPDPLEPIPANKRKYAPSGLMRCCINSLFRCDQVTEPGDVISCEHCTSTMYVASDGVVRWNRVETGTP